MINFRSWFDGRFTVVETLVLMVDDTTSFNSFLADDDNLVDISFRTFFFDSEHETRRESMLSFHSLDSLLFASFVVLDVVNLFL